VLENKCGRRDAAARSACKQRAGCNAPACAQLPRPNEREIGQRRGTTRRRRWTSFKQEQRAAESARGEHGTAVPGGTGCPGGHRGVVSERAMLLRCAAAGTKRRLLPLQNKKGSGN
jgi:hypothetical protein